VGFREFADSIQKPFGVRYNPYTQSVEILSNTDKIVALVSELRGDLCIVSNALRKIHAEDEAVENINNMLHKGMNMSGVSPEKSPEK
jgi:tryptophan 5-monooxygenase